MATVILLRHGRTTANATGVLAGRSKGVHLDDVGRPQAERAGDRLAAVRLAGIVSSPLERCRETAAAVAARQAPPLKVRTESLVRAGEKTDSSTSSTSTWSDSSTSV